MRRGTYCGQELVQRPRRLALMNLFLHGLEPEISEGAGSMAVEPGEREASSPARAAAALAGRAAGSLASIHMVT